MEADELLAFLLDDGFVRYFEAVRDGVALVGDGNNAHVFDPSKPLETTASYTDADRGTGPSRRIQRVAIARPKYEDTENRKRRLIDEVRQLAVKNAAAEKRLLLVDDRNSTALKTAEKEHADVNHRLSQKVMELSGLMAYETIANRVITEAHRGESRGRASEALEKRRELLTREAASGRTSIALRSPRKKRNDDTDPAILTAREAQDLFDQASAETRAEKAVWPGRYHYVVLEPPTTNVVLSSAAVKKKREGGWGARKRSPGRQKI